MSAPGQDTAALVVDAETALREERDKLGLDDGEQPAALCLSGGGIRSAAVCLGVLQALARRDLLSEFHYLSTVSGGGYTGGWLTRLIADQNDRADSAGKGGGVAKVQEILSGTIASQQPELDRLRRFTNFLTPNPGLASLDTWAGIVLWLRNTVINWILFLPVMLAIAAVPVLYFVLFCAMARDGAEYSWLPATLALLGLFVSVSATLWQLPSYKDPEKDPTAVEAGKAAPEIRAGRRRPIEKRFGASAPRLRDFVVTPVLVWAFLLPLALAPTLNPPQANRAVTVAEILEPPCPKVAPTTAVNVQCAAGPSFVLPMLDAAQPGALAWQVPLGAFLVAVVAYVGAGIASTPRFAVFRANWLAWVGSALASAVLLFFGIHVATGVDAAWIALAGPLGIVVTEILRSSLYVALRKDGLRSDLDREWLARLSAHKLRVVLAFAVLGFGAVVLPWMVFDGTTFGGRIAAISALVSGPAAALLGKSATTLFSRTRQAEAKTLKPPLDWLLVAAAVLFGVTILVALGNFVEAVASGTASWAEERSLGESASIWVAILAVAGLILIMAGVVAFVGRRINLNRFSMHAVYRNRIVRAFMGSARHDHQPDRYTSFDPLDDIRVSDAFDRTGSARRLFPVINVALNRTTGKDTARAARKAVSFTITPLRCGGASLIRTEKGKPWAKDGAYVRTSDYAGSEKEVGEDDGSRGLRLGTAVTLSGAAVSPNMGYHSSQPIAFLMTLFNVRLGAWLPNPATVANKHSALQSGPRNGVRTILSELVGVSSDESPFVYLSDGGHFDNLGLYEMLRRRCGRIVVVDAAQDEAYGYYDLGTVLQRARIDFGININFLQSITVGKAELPIYGAYASVVYPEVEALGRPKAVGSIIYLKSWLPGDAPTPLKAFQALKANFPHDTTANQFFTETDFESYRALGDYLADQMLQRTHAAAGKGQVASGLSNLERVFFGAERLHDSSA